MKQRIPIFFASDDNYLPYLAVAVQSIADFASDEYFYDIRVLCDGIDKRRLQMALPKSLRNMTVTPIDMHDKVAGLQGRLSARLRDYYSLAIYYRIFIPSMFPQLKKALYLDCDIVARADVAELYFTDLGGALLGAVPDESIPGVPEFCAYVENWVGVPAKEYFNSGVLVMDLEGMRETGAEENFIYLLSKYDFPTVAPDQDYLNFMCKGRVRLLDASWNKQPKENGCQSVNGQKIIHYNLYNKPWHYEGIPYEELFWNIADRTAFKEEIREDFRSFDILSKAQEAMGGRRLIEYAGELSRREDGFSSVAGGLLLSLSASIKKRRITQNDG